MAAKRSALPLGLLMTIAAAAAGFGAGQASSPTIISQEGRAFAPGEIKLSAGTTLRVVNDDRFVHNVHSQTEGFEVDSKVQRPGDQIDVYFRQRGYYELGCRVHPKMKLAVTVE